jgi:hypothetical protein
MSNEAINIAIPAKVTITPKVLAVVLSLLACFRFIPEIIAATEKAEIANATGANAITYKVSVCI